MTDSVHGVFGVDSATGLDMHCDDLFLMLGETHRGVVACQDDGDSPAACGLKEPAGTAAFRFDTIWYWVLAGR